MMVAALPKTRTGADEDRAALARRRGRLATARQLTDAIDADTAAYDQVIAAYKQPKATPEEQAARKSGDSAGAARCHRCAARRDAPVGGGARTGRGRWRRNGHRAAASDVGVAVALLRAGLRGARLNVEINLGGITDAAYGDAVREAETHGSCRRARRTRRASATSGRRRRSPERSLNVSTWNVTPSG